ncbi:MAG: hypothetical protein RI101_13845 [Nitrospira sp.]|nr:hypothetical protein [Nitrospira sp.]
MTYAGSIVLLSGLLALGTLMGCGIVGPPIPPEDVGVARTIAQQKKQHEREAAGQKRKIEEPVTGEGTPLAPVGQDQELPPLRPVGTR